MMHDIDEMEDMSREDKIMYKKHELREEQRKKRTVSKIIKTPMTAVKMN